LKTAGVITAFAAIILVAMLNNSKRVRALTMTAVTGEKNPGRQGFEIAPVHLNREGQTHALVGLGSYVVNASATATAATPQARRPNLLSPPFSGTVRISTAAYLGGGRDFGPVGSVPHLYSRNSTPDRTGLPEGGRTYEESVEIMRHGTDFDHVHPNCTAPGTPANCFMPPFNGDRP
jgi:hypothetical protein